MRNIDQQKRPTTWKGNQLYHKEKVLIYITLAQEVARKDGWRETVGHDTNNYSLRPRLK
jgi:hypothetical protein